MGWSTKEVATLAGTTLRAVRHYHEMGLLAEPPRSSNNYKNYGVTHLTQLLRIRRLVALGAPLAEIRDMAPEAEDYADTLRALDAEASETIQRLEQVRREIAEQLATPADEVPAESPALLRADEDFLMVLSRLLEDDSYEAWREMADHAPADSALQEFAHLSEDASDAVRERISRRLAEVVRNLHQEAPLLRAPDFRPSGKAGLARKSLHVALAELYNPAQTDVLARTGRLLETPRG